MNLTPFFRILMARAAYYAVAIFPSANSPSRDSPLCSIPKNGGKNRVMHALFFAQTNPYLIDPQMEKWGDLRPKASPHV